MLYAYSDFQPRGRAHAHLDLHGHECYAAGGQVFSIQLAADRGLPWEAALARLHEEEQRLRDLGKDPKRSSSSFYLDHTRKNMGGTGVYSQRQSQHDRMQRPSLVAIGLQLPDAAMSLWPGWSGSNVSSKLLVS